MNLMLTEAQTRFKHFVLKQTQTRKGNKLESMLVWAGQSLVQGVSKNPKTIELAYC